MRINDAIYSPRVLSRVKTDNVLPLPIRPPARPPARLPACLPACLPAWLPLAGDLVSRTDTETHPSSDKRAVRVYVPRQRHPDMRQSGPGGCRQQSIQICERRFVVDTISRYWTHARERFLRVLG